MEPRRPRRRYNRNVELVLGTWHPGNSGICGPPGVAYRLIGRIAIQSRYRLYNLLRHRASGPRRARRTRGRLGGRVLASVKEAGAGTTTPTRAAGGTTGPRPASGNRTLGRSL